MSLLTGKGLALAMLHNECRDAVKFGRVCSLQLHFSQRVFGQEEIHKSSSGTGTVRSDNKVTFKVTFFGQQKGQSGVNRKKEDSYKKVCTQTASPYWADRGFAMHVT